MARTYTSGKVVSKPKYGSGFENTAKFSGNAGYKGSSSSVSTTTSTPSTSTRISTRSSSGSSGENTSQRIAREARERNPSLAAQGDVYAPRTRTELTSERIAREARERNPSLAAQGDVYAPRVRTESSDMMSRVTQDQLDSVQRTTSQTLISTPTTSSMIIQGLSTPYTPTIRKEEPSLVSRYKQLATGSILPTVSAGEYTTSRQALAGTAKFGGNAGYAVSKGDAEEGRDDYSSQFFTPETSRTTSRQALEGTAVFGGSAGYATPKTGVATQADKKIREMEDSTGLSNLNVSFDTGEVGSVSYTTEKQPVGTGTLQSLAGANLSSETGTGIERVNIRSAPIYTMSGLSQKTIQDKINQQYQRQINRDLYGVDVEQKSFDIAKKISDPFGITESRTVSAVLEAPQQISFAIGRGQKSLEEKQFKAAEAGQPIRASLYKQAAEKTGMARTVYELTPVIAPVAVGTVVTGGAGIPVLSTIASNAPGIIAGGVALQSAFGFSGDVKSGISTRGASLTREFTGIETRGRLKEEQALAEAPGIGGSLQRGAESVALGLSWQKGAYYGQIEKELGEGFRGQSLMPEEKEKLIAAAKTKRRSAYTGEIAGMVYGSGLVEKTGQRVVGGVFQTAKKIVVEKTTGREVAKKVFVPLAGLGTVEGSTFALVQESARGRVATPETVVYNAIGGAISAPIAGGIIAGGAASLSKTARGFGKAVDIGTSFVDPTEPAGDILSKRVLVPWAIRRGKTEIEPLLVGIGKRSVKGVRTPTYAFASQETTQTKGKEVKTIPSKQVIFGESTLTIGTPSQQKTISKTQQPIEDVVFSPTKSKIFSPIKSKITTEQKIGQMIPAPITQKLPTQQKVPIQQKIEQKIPIPITTPQELPLPLAFPGGGGGRGGRGRGEASRVITNPLADLGGQFLTSQRQKELLGEKTNMMSMTGTSYLGGMNFGQGAKNMIGSVSKKGSTTNNWLKGKI